MTTRFRSLALAASLIAGSALPAMAQTPMADPAPATPGNATAAPLPDTGIKRAAPEMRAHHSTHHHQHAKPAAAPTPPAKAGL